MPSPDDWTLVVSGGGSGGHLFPAIAVIEELQKSFPPRRIVCLTSDRPLDERILQKHQIEQVPIASADSFRLRKRPLHALTALRKAWIAAEKMLKSMHNPLVIGTGGFSSAPGVLAARRLAKPVLLLEQNIVPGLATSWLCRPSAPVIGLPLPLPLPSPVFVCSSFEEGKNRLPKRTVGNVTGNPVRKAIVDVAAAAAHGRGTTLLVLGGSQGTAALNTVLIECLRSSAQFKEWKVIHQTGERDCASVQKGYAEAEIEAEVAPFFDDIAMQYARASLVVSRAGATSLAELACAGIPAILVPYPGAVRDHQRANARHFADHGAALIVEQGRDAVAFQRQLAEQLSLLAKDEMRRESMSQAMQSLAVPDAARKVAKSVRFLVRNWDKARSR